MDLVSTFIGGLSDFTLVAIVGFVIVFALLWVIGRSAYKG